MQPHKIKLFGPLKDIIGSSQIDMENISTIDQLRNGLIEQYPQLKSFIFSVAINHEIKIENQEIKTNDEIALLPPFAGG